MVEQAWGAVRRAGDRIIEWRNGRRRVWGELRYNIYLGLFAFALAAVAIGMLLGRLVIPGDGVFVYGSRILSGDEMRRQILVPYYGIVLVMIALIYLHLVRVLIIPVERLRMRMRKNRKNPNEAYGRQDLEILEIAVQTAQRQARDLEDVLQRQKELLAHREHELETARLRHQCFSDAVAEAVIEIDHSGTIIEASPTAPQLLQTSRHLLLGRHMNESLRLFEADKPDWLQYPLAPAIEQTLYSELAAPRIFQALLIGGRGEEIKVAVTVLPYGGQLRQQGGTIKLVSDGVIPNSLDAAPTTLSHLDQDSGLPNNQSFRRRIADLIEGHRTHALEHTVGLFLVGGLRDEDDPTDHLRHELAQTLARNLRRSMDSTAEIYRIGGIAFGIIKIGTQPASMVDLFETVRALCQLDLSRQSDLGVSLTVRYALTTVGAEASKVDEVFETLVTQMTGQLALGATRPSLDAGDHAQLAERARWVSERLLENRLHLVSQTVLPTGDAADWPPWLEVFARIEDEDGHWLEPAHFLKAVEHAGNGGRLDAEVFKRILKACRDEPELIQQFEGISLNVSTQSLCDEDFLNELVEMSRSLDGQPGRFAIEVDHRVASAPSAAMAGLELIQAAGLRIIIDGCNDIRSLRAFSRVQPYMVKLNGDLLEAAKVDPLVKAELQAIISSARVLGLRLSAKNVRGKEELPALSELGIQYAQGAGLEALGPIFG